MSLDTLAGLFTTPAAPAPAATPDADPPELRGRWTDAQWAALTRRPALLDAVRLAFAIEAERRAGRAPSHYGAVTTCAQCGPVHTWPGGPAQVAGCVWCANRAAGLPVPRPAATPDAAGAGGPEPWPAGEL